jgi:hypothetical protein
VKSSAEDEVEEVTSTNKENNDDDVNPNDDYDKPTIYWDID